MANLFRAYERLLVKYPLAVQCFQTGCLMGGGDLISQTIIYKRDIHTIHYKRTAQFFAIGLCLTGPAIYKWYELLQKLVGTNGPTVTVKKVALDQLCFAPIFMPCILTAVGYLQHYKLDDAVDLVRDEYWDILMANYKVWPAVQLINFYFLPLRYQVLFAQTFALVWNVYFAWKTEQHKSKYD